MGFSFFKMRTNVFFLFCSLFWASQETFGNNWILPGDGSWGTPANWSPAIVPNAIDAVADFPTTPTPRIIDLNVLFTIGSMTITTPASINTFSAASDTFRFLFRSNPGLAHLNLIGPGSSTINARVNIQSSLEVSVTNGGFLTFGDAAWINGEDDLSRNFLKSGDGTLIIGPNASTSNYGGTTTISGGFLKITTDRALPPASALTVDLGATWQIDGPSAVTIGSIAGAGTIQAPTIGSPTIITCGGDNTSTNFSGDISGGASNVGITKVGTGTLTLSGINSQLSELTINEGTLAATSAASLGVGSTLITLNDSATLQTTNDLTIAASTITLNNTPIISPNTGTELTISGDIGGSGSLTKTGTSSLTLSGINTYTGGTTVSAGTLALSVGGSIAASSSLNLSSATSIFDISGVTTGATVKNLTGIANSSVVLGNSKTLTVDNTSNSTFSGIISDTVGGALIKTGTGTLTLSGINTYTGGTTLSKGILLISSGAIPSTGSININGGSLVASGSSSPITLVNNSVIGGNFSLGQNAINTSAITLSGDMNLGSSTREIIVNNTRDTISGIISGDGGIQLRTFGTTAAKSLIIYPSDLGGNNYSGGTLISSGTLIVGGTTPLGSGTITFGGSAVALAAFGANPITLDNDTTFTNNLIIGQSSTNTGSITLSGAMNISFTNRIITINNPADTISGVISSGTYSGGIELQAGAPTNALTISPTFGGNTYVGGTKLTSGTLIVDGTTPLGRGNITFNGASFGICTLATPSLITLTNTTTFTNNYLTLGQTDTNTGSITLSGAMSLGNGIRQVNTSENTSHTISGKIYNGGLEKGEPGTLILSNAANDYAQGTTLSGGTLIVSSGAIPSTGNLTINDGTLATNGSFAIEISNPSFVNGYFSLGQDVTNTGSITLSGAMDLGGEIEQITTSNNTSHIISGKISNGGLIKAGSGILTLSNGTNDYTSQTEVADGKLALSVDGSIATSPSLNLSSATSIFDISGVTTGATVKNLNGVIGSSITLGASKNLTVENNSDTEFAGSISDVSDGVLIKTGIGALTLSSASSYQGGTNLSAGTIIAGNDSAIGTGTLTIEGNTTLAAQGNVTSVTLSNPMIILGDFTLGQDTINTIDLTLSGGMNLGTATRTITVNNPINRISGVISNFYAGLIKTGPGTLELSNINTYIGVTEVQEGTLALIDAGSITTSSALNLSTSNATFDISEVMAEATVNNLTGVSGSNILLGSKKLIISTDSNSQFNGTIAGEAGSITKTGADTLSLISSNSTYSGATTISDGVLSVSSIKNSGQSSSIGAPSDTDPNKLIFDGGTLKYAGTTTTTDRGFTINNGETAVIDIPSTDLTISGSSASTTGALTKNGDGDLFLAGEHFYTGATRVTGEGTLGLSGSGSIANSSSIGLEDTSTLDISGITTGSTTIQSLSGANTTRVNLGDKNLVINSTTETTFAGVIDDDEENGSLTKSGSEKLILSGINTYSGPTTINDGILSISSSAAIGSGDLNMNNGATLLATDSFDISRPTTLGTGGGTFEVDDSKALSYSASAIISGEGSLSKTGDGTLYVSSENNTYEGGTNIESGTLIITNDKAAGKQPTLGETLYAYHIDDGATLAFDVSSFSTDRQIELTGGTANITIPVGFEETFNGLIYGDGGLNVNGAGTMVLTKGNDYTGTTTIQNGTLKIENDSGSATGSGDVIVGNGGSLSRLGLSGSIEGAVEIQDGANLIAYSGGILTLGELTLSEGSSSIFKLNYGPTTDPLVQIDTAFTVSDSTTVNIQEDSVLTVGNYRLFDYPGIDPDPSYINLLPAQLGIYNLALNFGSGFINLAVTSSIENQWKHTGSLIWGDVANWWGESVPNGAGQTALFWNNNGEGFGPTEQAVVEEDKTIGSLVLDNSGTVFTISASSDKKLIMDGDSADASILVEAAPDSNNHTVSAPLDLKSNLEIEIVGGTFGLDIQGAISESDSSKTVTKIGLGPLTLSGSDPNSYTGQTIVSAGTLYLNKTGGNAIGVGGLQIESGAEVICMQSNQIYDGAELIVSGLFNLGTFSETVGKISGSGQIETGAGSVLTVVSSENFNYAGPINGSGRLVQAGTGTLTLESANTYSGGTEINSGVISVCCDNNLGTGGLTFGGNGALFFTGGFSTSKDIEITNSATLNTNTHTITLTGLISGSGDLVKEGSGILEIPQANSSYTGSTVINLGKIKIDDAASLGTGTNGITVNSGGVLQLNGDDFSMNKPLTLAGGKLLNLNNHTYSGSIALSSDSEITTKGAGKLTIDGEISGSGKLTKYGCGTLELSSTNNYTGSTDVVKGILSIKNSSALGTGSVTIRTGTELQLLGNGLLVNNNLSINGGILSNPADTNTYSGPIYLADNLVANAGMGATLILSGVITENGSPRELIKNGPGTLTLSSENTYTGATTISEGTLTLSGNGSIAASSGLNISDAIFDISNATSDTTIKNLAGIPDSEVILGNTNLTIQSTLATEFEGAITGDGGLTKTGNAKLTLSGPNLAYTGATTISEGTLTLSGNGSIATSSGLTISNATFDISEVAGVATIKNLAGISDSEVILGNTNLTIQSTSATEFEGAITGDGGLTKTGGGALTLSGSNDYSGGTTLSAGTLIASTNAIPNTGSLTINAGTTLAARLASDLTISNNSTINGNFSLGQTIDNTGSITLSNMNLGGGVRQITTANPTNTIAGIISNGGLTKAGTGTLILSNENIYTGATTISEGTLTLLGNGSIATSSGLNISNAVFDISNVTTGATVKNLVGDSGSGAVVGVSKTLTVESTSPTQFQGIISGGGALTKIGTSNLTLSGLNTYAGGTTVSGGSLILTGANGSIASSSNITIGLGATLKLDNTSTANNTHRLKDDASITMQGGTFIFSNNGGSVNYSEITGALTINAGTNIIQTFQAGEGQTSTLTFESLTYTDGTIDFVGMGLGVTNRNRIFFTTPPTFGPWAFVNGGLAGYDNINGVKALSSLIDIAVRGGIIPDGSGNDVRIETNGTSGHITLENTVTTIKSLQQNNANYDATVDTLNKTLRVEGILINSGKKALTIGVNANDGFLTPPTPGAILILNNSSASDLIINSIIANSHVVKNGSGTLILNGTNTYTGNTSLNAGVVKVNNSRAFGPTGSVAHGTSTLDVGTTRLAIGGSYTQTGSSTLAAIINGFNNGSVTSAGSATVNSTDNLIVGVYNYIPNNITYTIVAGSAGSSIAIPNITILGSNQATFMATTTGNTLLLTSNRDQNGFASDAMGPGDSNAHAVGVVLDNIQHPSSDMLTILNLLSNLAPEQVDAALNTMYPEIDGGVINTTNTMVNNFVAVSTDRMEKTLITAMADSIETGISAGEMGGIDGIWGKGYGSYLNQDMRNYIAGYRAWNAGMAIGTDNLFSSNVLLGLSGGYAYGDVDSKVNAGKTHVNSFQATAYMGYSDPIKSYFIDFAAFFAYNWYKGSRGINIADIIERTAHSKYGGLQCGAYASCGHKFVIKRADFIPLLSLQWNYLALDSYTETGADALDLRVKRQSYVQLQSGVGARISTAIRYNYGIFTPELHAKWLYNIVNEAMATTSNFTGGGAAFATNGAVPAPNGLNVGGQLTFDLDNDFSIYIVGDTEFRSQFFGAYGSVMLRYEF